MRRSLRLLLALAPLAAACAAAPLVPAERLDKASCKAKGWAARAEIQCTLPEELAAQRVRVVAVDATRMVISLAVEQAAQRPSMVMGVDRPLSVSVPKAGTYGIVFAGSETVVQTVSVLPQLRADEQVDTFNEVYGTASGAQ